MSEITVASCNMVKNAVVYDLSESVKASKYPMCVNTSDVTDEITNMTARLGSSEVGHAEDNFLNGIRVAFDLTFSNKAWVEAERYHFLDFVSSQSTMHRITKFDIKSQCNKYVDKRIIKILQEKVNAYNSCLELNKTKDEKEQAFLEVIYNIPSGFQLTARMTTDYRQLKTICIQREYHRLPEWREFCTWIHKLPYFDELCFNDGVIK
jgi:hypothetical protein